VVENELDGMLHSGMSFTLNIKRDPYFFMVYYIIPSVIFVVLAYSSFWID
jgi:hypothetical protein